MALAIDMITENMEVVSQALEIARSTERIPVELEKEVSDLVVTNAQQANHASNLRRTCKGMLKAIEDKFEPSVKAAFAAHRSMTGLRNEFTEPLAGMIKRIDAKVLTWQQAEAARVREENERAARELREKQEAERKRLEAEVAAEAARLAAQGSGFEAAKVKHEAAKVIEMTVQQTVTAPIPQAAPKVAGMTFRENWKAEVVSLHDLVKAAAANPDLLVFLSANESALNAEAKASKGSRIVPGVRFFDQPIPAGR